MLLKTRLPALLILLFIYSGTNAQIKNLHRTANKIADSLIIEKIIGTDTVKYVDQKYCKEGWNVFNLTSVKYVYVDYKSNVVRGILLSDTSGIVHSGFYFENDSTSSYNCTFAQCSCKGEIECFKMFEAKVSEYNKLCIGNTCFGTRPYEFPKFKKRVENN